MDEEAYGTSDWPNGTIGLSAKRLEIMSELFVIDRRYRFSIVDLTNGAYVLGSQANALLHSTRWRI